MIQSWRLDTQEQTLVLAATDKKLPQVVYWGAPLPEQESLETITKASVIDRTGGMLDKVIDLSLCPQSADTFPGHPGLIARNADGKRLLPNFFFTPNKATTTVLH